MNIESECVTRFTARVKCGPIFATDPTEWVNEAIAVPDSITTNDGRTLMVREWKPIVKTGNCVTVELVAVVHIDDTEATL